MSESTESIKLESWMYFIIIILTIGIQFYFQKEKFKESKTDLGLLRYFSQTITYQKIDKALRNVPYHIRRYFDLNGVGGSLESDLKFLSLVQQASSQKIPEYDDGKLSPKKKVE